MPFLCAFVTSSSFEQHSNQNCIEKHKQAVLDTPPLSALELTTIISLSRSHFEWHIEAMRKCVVSRSPNQSLPFHKAL